MTEQWLESRIPGGLAARVHVRATWDPAGPLRSISREEPTAELAHRQSWDAEDRVIEEFREANGQCEERRWAHGPSGPTREVSTEGYCGACEPGSSRSVSCGYQTGHLVRAEEWAYEGSDGCATETEWLWRDDRPYGQLQWDLVDSGTCAAPRARSYILEYDARGRQTGVLTLFGSYGVSGERARFDGLRLLSVDTFELEGLYRDVMPTGRYERRCAAPDCECPVCPADP